ncbi:MAG: response regulator transcription factor [Firmicutes bacterium]|nr:response regulator transcription factor [Bacillota bacterium]
MRVLVVEDEKRLADALGEILIEAKYTPDVVYDGEAGYDNASSGIYDVIILDVMLPKMDGLEIVKELRKNKVATPVLLLTARDSIEDRVKGLDAGADDYLTKPFAAQELLARVRAMSRRQGEVILDELTFGDLTLTLSAYTLCRGDKSVHLGVKEFDVMRMLMSAPKAIIPKEELILKIWGTESGAEDNNVEVYISFLRKKIFFLGSKVEIATMRKVGYYLKEKEA